MSTWELPAVRSGPQQHSSLSRKLIQWKMRQEERNQVPGDAIVSLHEISPDTYILLDFQLCEPVIMV